MTILEAVMWLAINVYHEARSEPQVAQIAVAHTVLNRAHGDLSQIKQVVTARGQYSWTYMSKRKWVPDDPEAFGKCVESAMLAIKYRKDPTKGATHYHLNKIRPRWAKTGELKRSAKIGKHTFYRRKT